VAQTNTRELTIIGGGLAGLTLGIGLRQRGVPVSLYEAGSLPRHRVCGEFICGKGAATLDAMGLSKHLADAVMHDEVYWYRNNKKLFRHQLPIPATGISRYLLDQRLSETFTQLGGNLHYNDRVRLDADSPPEAGVVLCNGRQRATGKPRWLGMKVHLKQMAPKANGLSVYLGHGCYVGLSAIEGGQFNLCGLFRLRADIKGGKIDRLMDYLQACGLDELCRLLQKSEVDESSFCAVAALDFAPPSIVPETLTVGDQFGMIAPFTGNGMSIALESAYMAIAPLCDYACGQCTWTDATHTIQRLFAKRFSVRMTVARWLHPLLLHPSGQASLGQLGRWQLLPLNPLFKLTH
jgi:flavin-dependent dehydrogenase